MNGRTRPNSQNEGMKVLLDDHVLNRVHRCLEQGRVSGVCVIDVYLTVRHSVDGLETIGEVFGCCIKVGG